MYKPRLCAVNELNKCLQFKGSRSTSHFTFASPRFSHKGFNIVLNSKGLQLSQTIFDISIQSVV